jgi:hypothetical protein
MARSDEYESSTRRLVKILLKWNNCRIQAWTSSSQRGAGDPMVFMSFQRRLRTVSVLALLAAPDLLVTSSAQAQSPMPYGLWRGQNSGDYILIRRDGNCSASGMVNVAGRCEWLSTSAGGVLNMYYPMPLQPGRIGWSVIWVNRNLLRINGVELFVRKG